MMGGKRGAGTAASRKKGMFGRMADALNRLNEKDTETVLYTLMCALTVPAAALFFLYMWAAERMLPAGFDGCLFRQAFHMYCPGCGGTRAVAALFQGKVLSALWYHPAAVYGTAVYAVFFVSQTLCRLTKGRVRGMRFRSGWLWVMLALVFGNFIVRNVLLLGFHIPTL